MDENRQHQSVQEESDAGREQTAPEVGAPMPEETSSDKGKGRWGKTAIFFGSLAVVALICFVIAYHDSFSTVLDYLSGIVSPIVVGGVIAYLCHPILSFYEYRVLRRMRNHTQVRRGLSLFLTILTVLVIIALIILMIVPELISSIKMLMTNYEEYAAGLQSMISNFLTSLTDYGVEVGPERIEWINTTIQETFGTLSNAMNTVWTWMNESNALGNALDSVGTSLMAAVGMLTDLILSLFIAFYLLSSRDKRVAQIRKFRHAVFNEKQNAKISAVVRLTDKTFNGFVFGVLIDALVVGVLTFLMLSIFEVSPYNLLIATIVAVTNVIPVFGPFIGAIPSAFIVLISNPSKVFLFIILILIIQQVDGNILCPKIQGDNTGVSSLAVLIAITVAGGMWGLGGMVIGVPIIAVIIEMGKRAIEERLIRKGKPVETTAYYPEDALGNAEKDVYYEHAGLRYEYEHSRFKHRFDRLRRRLLGDESNSKDSNDGAADGHTSEQTSPRSTEKKNKRKSNKK